MSILKEIHVQPVEVTVNHVILGQINASYVKTVLNSKKMEHAHAKMASIWTQKP